MLSLRAISLPTRYRGKVQGFNHSITYSSLLVFPKWRNEIAGEQLHVIQLSLTKFWDTWRKRMRMPSSLVALLKKLSGRSILGTQELLRWTF